MLIKCIDYDCTTDDSIFTIEKTSGEGDETPVYELRIETQEIDLVGSYQISIQAIDKENQYESEIRTLDVLVIDPCDYQLLKVNELVNSEINYELGAPLKQIEIEASKYLPECPTLIDLVVSCGDDYAEECPGDNFFSVVQSDQEN